MPPKIEPSSVSQTGKKGKNKGKIRRRINLKGWLKTPADWERFDAWAKANALPKKIPEPEPIVRLTRPLSQMKKRIEVLSQPMKKGDSSAVCRLDSSVSKAALKAKPSKRIKILAKFIMREAEHCREFPIKLKKSTLQYEPSERIIEISKPFIRMTEKCRAFEVSEKALKYKTSAKVRMMSLAKKSIECPDSLTDEEKDELMTSTGIMKSALTYKFTPWMSLLSLPSYRILKDRNDQNAKDWKKRIIEESETRGKKALEEKLKKEQIEKDKRKRRKKKEKTQDKTEVAREKEKTEAEGEKSNVEEKKDEATEDKIEEEQVPGEDVEPQEEQTEPQGEEMPQDQGIAEENREEKTNHQDDKAKKGRKRKRKPKEKTKDSSEENEKAKRRKIERNAWRYTPSSCKELGVQQSALKGKVPPHVNELSKPNIRKYQACRENPFGVRKSALSASASAKISELAKPKDPCDPVERPPPREKDEYGRPIFPIPEYGKILPEIKYKEAECKTDEKKEEKERKPKKSELLDRIAFGPTIDPYVDPRRAKKQQRERKKLAQRKNKSNGDGK